MKKSIIVTMLLSALVLTGCGGGGESQPQGSSEGEISASSDQGNSQSNSGGESSQSGGESSQSGSQSQASGSTSDTVSFTLAKEVMSVGVGEVATLTVNCETAGVAFQFVSDKPNIASVDANGVITGVAKGSAKITVTPVGKKGKAVCDVTVVDEYFIEENTEILVQTTFNDTYGQIFKDAINALAKKEPHLTVKYDKYSGSYSDLKDEVVKGVPTNNYPDVVAAYPDSVADFITAGVPLKMDKYMNNSNYGWTAEEKADFYEAYLAEGQAYSIPGTYSLPIAKSTEAMYYDSDKIIGLNLASVDPSINNGQAITEDYINSLTWDEMFNKFAPALLAYRETLPEASRKAFLDKDTYSDWAVVGYDSDDNLFITLAEQYGYGYTSMDDVTGEGHIDFVNDGMKNLMKQFNQAYKNKYFTTKGIIGTNINYRSNEDAVLFSIGSTGGVNYQFSAQNPKNVGVAKVPQAAGKATRLIQQGPSLAFLKHSDNSNNRGLGAWLFYKELTTVRSCIAWATTTGYSPIRKSVAESDEFLDFSDPDGSPAKTSDSLKALNAAYQESTMNYLFVSPVFKGSSEARTQVAGIATKAIGEKEELTDAKLNELFETAANNTALKM